MIGFGTSMPPTPPRVRAGRAAPAVQPERENRDQPPAIRRAKPPERALNGACELKKLRDTRYGCGPIGGTYYADTGPISAKVTPPMLGRPENREKLIRAFFSRLEGFRAQSNVQEP